MFIVEFRRKAVLFLIFGLVITGLAALTFSGHNFIMHLMSAQYASLQNNPSPLPFQKRMMETLSPIVSGDEAFYIWSQWTGRNLLQTLILAALILGLFDFVSEREGKWHTLLLNFQSRSSIFRAKTLSGMAVIIALSLFSLLLTGIFIAVFSFKLPLWNAVAGAIPVTLFALMVYQICFGLSLPLKRRGNGLILTMVLFILLPVTFGFYEPLLSALTGRAGVLTGMFDPVPVLIMAGLTSILWLAEYRAWNSIDF